MLNGGVKLKIGLVVHLHLYFQITLKFCRNNTRIAYKYKTRLMVPNILGIDCMLSAHWWWGKAHNSLEVHFEFSLGKLANYNYFNLPYIFSLQFPKCECAI